MITEMVQYTSDYGGSDAMQVVILDTDCFHKYRMTGLMPEKGAWIAHMNVARGTWEEVNEWIMNEVKSKEWYASMLSKRPERTLDRVEVYANLHAGDTVCTTNMLRLLPTESLTLPRQLDDSVWAHMPGSTVESIVKAADDDCVSNMRIASSTVYNQCMLSPMNTLIIVVTWLKEHTDLLRCVDTQCSSMMSVSEVQADFVLNNRRAQYAEGRDCQLAACEAAAFFDTTHRLMSPKIVHGVLYAGSVIQPVMGRTGRSPDAHALITPIMKRYVLDGCMWRAANDTDSHGVINARGCSHFVTRVITLDGQRVFVDWGIGQFSSLPEGVSLFVKMDDALDD
jgi:hypothetical protein